MYNNKADGVNECNCAAVRLNLAPNSARRFPVDGGDAETWEADAFYDSELQQGLMMSGVPEVDMEL